MIKKVLEIIESQEITIAGWIYSFVGILFVRFALESISSPSSSGIIPSDPYTLVHYGLYFLAVTLITILIYGFYTKEYLNSSKIILFGLPLIWLAPVIDIFVSGGTGYRMSYIFDSSYMLLLDFITFFGPNLTKGATIGIRLGIALSFLGIGYLIWLKTKKISKSLLGVLTIYVFVFILATLPGIIYMVVNPSAVSVESSEIVSFFEKNILRSTISHNTLREGFLSVSTSRFLELSFDKLMSQILFIISIISGLVLFWKTRKEKFVATFKNARPERINFYTASLFCGIAFAYINRAGNVPVVIDIFGIICIFVAWAALWMHAVHLNDIYDVDIDKISNTDRPLINNSLSTKEMGDIGKMWLAVALVGSWCAGFYPFFMALVYIACSYVYSAPPLRLRRLPLVPSFLIGVACLATVLSGYFFISTNKEIQSFPIFLSIGIVIMVTLAINFKDIKDIEGDRANGILTIPNIFPRYGIRIVAILFAISILLVPFFLSFYLLYIISIPCAVIGYKLITRKPYVEKYIFILRFFFLLGIGLAYILIFWLNTVYNLV
jgi:4-hydroxybenzoate polyprenyltransferase